MEQRRVGALEVSVAGLGCNNFGLGLDEAASAARRHRVGRSVMVTPSSGLEEPMKLLRRRAGATEDSAKRLRGKIYRAVRL